MQISYTMAFRNIFRQKRRTLLLASALALASLVMALITSFSAGLSASVRDNLSLSLGGQVVLTGISPGQGTSSRAQNRYVDDGKLLGLIKAASPEIVAVEKQISAQASFIFGSREQRLKVSGVQWETDHYYSQHLVLQAGSWEAVKKPGTLLMSQKQLDRFGAGLGDSFTIRLSTAKGQQNVIDLILAGVYEDSTGGASPQVYASFADLSRALDLAEGEFMSIAVQIRDANAAPALSQTIAASLKQAGYSLFDQASRQAAREQLQNRPSNQGNQASTGQGANQTNAQGSTTRQNRQNQGPQGGPGGFGGMPSMGGLGGFNAGGLGANLPIGMFGARLSEPVLTISTIQELMGQVSSIITTVQWIGALVFIIMLVLSAAGIHNTYRMIMLERQREIGTLRCVGMRRLPVLGMILSESSLLCAFGALLGLILAWPLALLIQSIPFAMQGTWSFALSQGHFILIFDPLVIVVVFVVVILTGLAASFGPARKTAWLQPLEALHSRN